MTSERPFEPTSPVKPVTRGRGDTPPPAPPQELARTPSGERTIEHEGRTWIARLGGKGACGTGAYGLCLVEAVHFYDPAKPERPELEALVARGRFDVLYDCELVELLMRARPVVDAETAPVVARPKTRPRD